MRATMRPKIVAALLFAALPLSALAMDDHVVVQPNALKWGPAPPGLPPGAQISVLSGNPGGDSPYVLRAGFRRATKYRRIRIRRPRM